MVASKTGRLWAILAALAFLQSEAIPLASSVLDYQDNGLAPSSKAPWRSHRATVEQSNQARSSCQHHQRLITKELHNGQRTSHPRMSSRNFTSQEKRSNGSIQILDTTNDEFNLTSWAIVETLNEGTYRERHNTQPSHVADSRWSNSIDETVEFYYPAVYAARNELLSPCSHCYPGSLNLDAVNRSLPKAINDSILHWIGATKVDIEILEQQTKQLSELFPSIVETSLCNAYNQTLSYHRDVSLAQLNIKSYGRLDATNLTETPHIIRRISHISHIAETLESFTNGTNTSANLGLALSTDKIDRLIFSISRSKDLPEVVESSFRVVLSNISTSVFFDGLEKSLISEIYHLHYAIQGEESSRRTVDITSHPANVFSHEKRSHDYIHDKIERPPNDYFGRVPSPTIVQAWIGKEVPYLNPIFLTPKPYLIGQFDFDSDTNPSTQARKRSQLVEKRQLVPLEMIPPEDGSSHETILEIKQEDADIAVNSQKAPLHINHESCGTHKPFCIPLFRCRPGARCPVPECMEHLQYTSTNSTISSRSDEAMKHKIHASYHDHIEPILPRDTEAFLHVVIKRMIDDHSAKVHRLIETLFAQSVRQCRQDHKDKSVEQCVGKVAGLI